MNHTGGIFAVDRVSDSARIRPNGRRRRGFILIAFSLALLFILGVAGLAFDIGRMYCARSEAQAFVDSAALAGAERMNGTKAGLYEAIAAATSSPDERKRWQFSTESFTDITVQFSKFARSGFVDVAAVPDPPTGYRFIRVETRVDVGLTLLRPLTNAVSSRVAAAAVAGQIKRDTFSDGVFPFSPMAPNVNAVEGDMSTWGFIPGELYTLQWASVPQLDHPKTMCAGDMNQSMIDRFLVDKNNRGFIVNGASAAEIAEVIVNGTEDYPISEGDSLMTTGTKESETKYVAERSDRDADPETDFWSYLDGPETLRPKSGNGLRLVIVPVNSGPPDRKVLGFARFLLQPPSDYKQGGNRPMCAWYVGAGIFGGSGRPVEENGLYVIALVR
ncbi:MAG: TadE/TadG family type IV pilus assembly protein [bacterium]